MSRREIVFVLTDDEDWKEEKRRFYQSQVDLLTEAGLQARLVRANDKDAVEGARQPVFVFDLGAHAAIAPLLEEGAGETRLLAPVLWNPYVFWEASQCWIRAQHKVAALLVPGAAHEKNIRHYPHGQKLGTLNVATHYVIEGKRDEPIEGRLPRIGYLSHRSATVKFVQGYVSRMDKDFAGIEWVELNFSDPSGWQENLPACDILFALRPLSGSALPLLDAMAAGLLPFADHGGGLTGIASAENGVWVDSVTPEKIALQLIDLIRCYQNADPALSGMRKQAMSTAEQASARVTFSANYRAWNALASL